MKDRLAFLALERERLDVLDGAFVLVNKQGVRTHIPVGSVAALLLEPGIRISHAAVALALGFLPIAFQVIWHHLTVGAKEGNVVMAWSTTTNESSFEFATLGSNRRRPVDFDGVRLVAFEPPPDEEPEEDHEESGTEKTSSGLRNLASGTEEIPSGTRKTSSGTENSTSGTGEPPSGTPNPPSGTPNPSSGTPEPGAPPPGAGSDDPGGSS
jgi:hypothetical protein